ncbi:MAG: alanine racemase [Rickettsiales bacterium]|jgi:alanine racemase|nr:alanine racemase [Rickettsiales bacterium]
MLKIDIDYSKIKDNLEFYKKLTGYKSDYVVPTLKANAYSFELEKILKLYEKQNIFCIYSTDEGVRARQIRGDAKIFVFSALFPEDIAIYKKYNLIPVINSFEQLKISPFKEIALQFNTGMNRSGIEISELKQVQTYIKQNNINVFLIMSHLCCADDIKSPVNQIQFDNYKKICDTFDDTKIIRSLLATDATENFYDTYGRYANSSRIGFGLYYNKVWCLKIKCDVINDYLPVGLKDGFLSDYAIDGYVVAEGEKVKITKITEDRIFLEKNLNGKEVIILGDEVPDYNAICGSDSLEAIPRLLAKNININVEGQKLWTENDGYYSRIMEVREISEDGVVGYGATREVKKGVRLAVYAGGYLDGTLRVLSNSGAVVYVENTNGDFVACELYGRISMDQSILNIGNNDINIGAKVIIYDKDHPKDRFCKNINKTETEIFYMLDKSYRVRHV